MTTPSWKDLEAPSPKADENSVQKTLARIGDTSDGKILIEYLKKTVLYADPPPGASNSALWEHVGERRFVKRILHSLEQPVEHSKRT